MGIDVDPAETLTDYIERRRREFESKADGGSIGIEVLFKEKMKDGGRAGFFMGGPALEGQALQIYNSMKNYNFSDQEIADALSARGLYTAAGNTTTPVTNTAPNIINQGGDGPNDGPTNITGGSSFFGGLNVEDPEADAYGIGPTVGGTFARMRSGLGNIVTTLRSLPTPLNLALRAIENIRDPYKNVLGGLNKATRDAINRESVRDLQGRIDRGDFGSTTPTPQDRGRGGGGSSSTGGRSGGFDQGERGGRDGRKEGGLATMFTRRR
jgi:hypothetical protein